MKPKFLGRYLITIISPYAKAPARNAFSIADAGGKNKKI